MKTSAPPSETIETIETIEARLRPQSTEDLRFRFHECFAGAANLINEAAVCVKLLQERGENLSGLHMVGTFRRVASGQVLAELIWKFIESPSFNRQAVERLPLDDQKKLARDPMVVLVEPKPKGGGYERRRVDLTTAPAPAVKLAIGPDGLRSVEEQLAYLGAHKTSYAVVKAVAEKDEEEEVIQEPLTHQVVVKLTSTEMEALKIRAALAHCTEREIARRYLLTSGALKQPRT